MTQEEYDQLVLDIVEFGTVSVSSRASSSQSERAYYLAEAETKLAAIQATLQAMIVIPDPPE